MTLAAAVAAVFTGQFVKGVTGFGSALVAVPVLAWAYGAPRAVFLAVFLDMFSGFTLLRAVFGSVRWGLVAVVFLPVFVGQWLGTELLTYLPEEVTQRVVGVLVALFGLDIALRPSPDGVGELEDLPDEGRGTLFAWGAVAGGLAGLLGGLVGTPGPPIVIYMRRYFVPAFFRAQVIAVFAVSAVTLVPMLWLKGVPEPGDPWLGLGLCLPMIVGALIGERVASRLDKRTFARAVGAVLVTAGVALAL